MEKNSKSFSGRFAKLFDKKKSKNTQPSTRTGLPPEIFLVIIQFLDPHSLINLAPSCRWLFCEVSKRKLFWKECYYQKFPFDRDDQELKWLQQLRAQQQRSEERRVGKE